MIWEPERSGKIEDLENAIEKGTLAVEILPQDHQERAIFLTNLGTSHSLSPQPGSQGRALNSFLRAWNFENGLPFVRLRAAAEALYTFKHRNDLAQASKIAMQAVILVSKVNNRSLDRGD